VKIQLAITILSLVSSIPALACTSSEARELIETNLLAQLDPALGCEVSHVGQAQKNLWGNQYFPVTVRCQGGEREILRQYRVLINEKSGRCEYGT